MALHELKTYGPPIMLPMQIEANCSDAKRLIHIGIHNSANRNAGDTLLFPVVRRVFDQILGPFTWELHQVWDPFTIDTALQINATANGIVLGGGGLLLRDQAGSDISNSGWQWNSTVAAVQAIEVPLSVLAIGYNRFREQMDFDPIFIEHIRAVVDRSFFFGLRNNGSQRALAAYLPSELTAKLRRQFCPTTVLWQLYPEHRASAEAYSEGRRVFAFNAAFDRANLRFGKRVDEVLLKLAQAVRVAEKRGWKIIVAAHKTMDREIEPFLDRVGVTYNTVDMTDASPEDIMAFYAQVDFVFGMRGHAQMIPFGLRRPIMSIISHDKLRYFLEDINRLEWGVEVDAPDIAERLESMLNRIENEPEQVYEEISQIQQMVWIETQNNLKEIGYHQFGISSNRLIER